MRNNCERECGEQTKPIIQQRRHGFEDLCKKCFGENSATRSNRPTVLIVQKQNAIRCDTVL